MNEDEWFENVDIILSDKGVSVDLDNDGWLFMFENGFTESEAISEMLNY